MGLRGPQPKPTALKEAQGNPGKRRLNDGEPIPPPPASGVIEPPSWLSPRARQAWDQLAPIGLAMKTLTTADVFAWARYCESMVRWIDLTALMWGKGASGTTYAIKDSAGNVKYMQEIPQAIEHRRLFEIIIRLEQNLGLTPAARSRLRIEPSREAAAGPAPQTPDEAADQARRDFFAGGGPAAPRETGKRGKRGIKGA